MSKTNYYYGISGVAASEKSDLTDLQIAELVLEDLKTKLPYMTPQDLLDVLDFEADEEEA